VTDKTPPKTGRKTESRIFRRVPKELWPALGSSPGASCEAAIRALLDLWTKHYSCSIESSSLLIEF
jgi:hypothetical protein